MQKQNNDPKKKNPQKNNPQKQRPNEETRPSRKEG